MDATSIKVDIKIKKSMYIGIGVNKILVKALGIIKDFEFDEKEFVKALSTKDDKINIILIDGKEITIDNKEFDKIKTTIKTLGNTAAKNYLKIKNTFSENIDSANTKFILDNFDKLIPYDKINLTIPEYILLKIKSINKEHIAYVYCNILKKFFKKDFVRKEFILDHLKKSFTLSTIEQYIE